MSKKRKDPSSAPSDSPNPKKSRPDELAPPQPRNDPVYGQKHAFPGLDDEAEDGELFYGPPENGLEYLRMVRSEANKLPVVFIAQETTVTGDGVNNSSVRHHLEIEDGKSTAERRHEGTYSDGVYVAPRIEAKVVERSSTIVEQEYEEEGEVHEDREKEVPDAQEVYYNLLRHRFLLLRSTLKCSPPASAISALDPEHPISLPENTRKARLEWGRLLQMTEPKMSQLACMEPETVLRLIAILTRSISQAAQSEEVERVKRLGAWAWGLLGRCREVGQMGSEEVAELRELGKRAVKILVKLRSPEIRQALEEASRQGDGAIEDSEAEGQSDQEEAGNQEESSGPDMSKKPSAKETDNTEAHPTTDATEEESSELEAAKARLQARLETESTNGDKSVGLKQNIFSMLDMIISITGEFYGQRDLLEFRDIWDENSDEW